MNNDNEKLELPDHKIYAVNIDIGEFTIYVVAENEKQAKIIAGKEDIRDHIDPEICVSALKAGDRIEYSWRNEFPINMGSKCLLKIDEYMVILNELERRHKVWLENDKKQLKLNLE